MYAKGDYRGEGVAVDMASRKITPQSIERSRDAFMVQLKRQGYSTRVIAAFLGLNQSNVVRRLKSIPPSVRERYEKVQIFGL